MIRNGIRGNNNEIKKFTSPLVTDDIGSIIRGKYTFFIIPSFIKIDIIP